MQRVQKQGSEPENAQRTAQAKFTSWSRENERANAIDDSPAMIAQRKKLNSLFGGAIQRVEDEEPLQGKFETAQRVEEEEPLQGKFEAVQRVEEEEPLQGKFETAQRVEEEEPLQGRFEIAQRVEEEEPLQGKFEAVQREEEEEPLQGKFEAGSSVQLKDEPAAKPNNTGLPDNLKSGIENLSGMSMDNVKVHYNSSQPAQLNALAYAQGTDIHVAPGQEQHLPHEAWHVVQQAQGRVKPTMQMKEGVPVNDDRSLEHEADVMGAKAVQMKAVVQKFDPLKTPRNQLNQYGKWAYDLLDNDRAGFKSIDKTGGDVNAEQDGNKRVTKAWKQISSKAAPRNQALQTGIGWLGNLEEENVSAGYNGGHLIASSLGGSGTWQNMVPQDGPENKWGDWRQYEKENKKALEDTGAPLIVTVELGYSGDSVLPTSWNSWLTDINGKDVNWYSAQFV